MESGRRRTARSLEESSDSDSDSSHSKRRRVLTCENIHSIRSWIQQDSKESDSEDSRVIDVWRAPRVTEEGEDIDQNLIENSLESFYKVVNESSIKVQTELNWLQGAAMRKNTGIRE